MEVTMIHELISKIDNSLQFQKAKAHCDVPCGIYDPIVAQINAISYRHVGYCPVTGVKEELLRYSIPITILNDEISRV